MERTFKTRDLLRTMKALALAEKVERLREEIVNKPNRTAREERMLRRIRSVRARSCLA